VDHPGFLSRVCWWASSHIYKINCGCIKSYFCHFGSVKFYSYFPSETIGANIKEYLLPHQVISILLSLGQVFIDLKTKKLT